MRVVRPECFNAIQMQGCSARFEIDLRASCGWIVDTSLRRKRHSPGFSAEALETRALLSATPFSGTVTSVPAVEPGAILRDASDLGALNPGQDLHIAGEIATETDVDWYRFTLQEASTVEFSVSSGVIGLYNNSLRSSQDRLTLGDHRLLQQASSTDSTAAEIQRRLAPGTYFIAISGLGNRYFSTGLADTGLSGTVGEYSLDMAGTSLSLDPALGPVVLATDITPIVARIDFSQPLNIASAVQLVDTDGNSVPLNWWNNDSAISELQIAPTQSFVAGSYRVIISDATGVVRATVPFDVAPQAASESGLLGNDTPLTAIDLGNIEGRGVVQVAGTIGDDRYYPVNGADLTLSPASDVDLYHFSVTSSTPIGMLAEVFAGRINSTLDTGLSLYRLDPLTGHLQFIAGNNNTSNVLRSADGMRPLAFDSALAAGLTAGDYYIAVAGGGNTVSPIEGMVNAEGSGFFNPEMSHSGSAGSTVGAYVLNLRVIPIPDPPEVTSVSIGQNSALPDSPTQFSVQFSEFMNLTEQANSAFSSTSHNIIEGVYIENSLGVKYFPRLVSFDSSNFVAQFLILDRLAAGTYQLHLDGAHGVTNIVGAPLVGNTSDGDYVVDFNVAQTNPGTNGNPLVWTHDVATDATNSPQSLGVLFPAELQVGVSIQRNAAIGAVRDVDRSDDYRFQVIQGQSYTFILNGDRLPAGVTLQIFDASGHIVNASSQVDPVRLLAQLAPGNYVLHVGNGPPAQMRNLAYQIDVKLVRINDNPPPLYSGPVPAVNMRLVSAADAAGSSGMLSNSNFGQSASGSVGISKGTGNGVFGELGGGALNGNVSSANAGSSPAAEARMPSFLGERQGALRINLPSNADNFAIAIPTVSGSSDDRSGSLFQVARSLRRTSNGQDGLSLGGLFELADGPVGKANSEVEDVSPSLKAMHKLRGLIHSALSHQPAEEIADESTRDAVPGDSIDEATAFGRDVMDSEPQLEEKKPQNVSGDRGEPVATRMHKARVDSGSVQPLAASTIESLPLSDVQFVRSVPQVDSTNFDGNGSGLEVSPDTLFASGISLLLLDAAIRKVGAPVHSRVTASGKRAELQMDKLQPV